MPPLSPGKRRFAPTWGFTVLALLAAAVCVRLGVWQWHKGVLREAEVARFARGAERTLTPGSTPLTELPLFQRVSVSGELDGAHQFLLENRSYQGRPGYEVLTPLVRPGKPTLLVDRGWVPFTGSRARLPQVSLADAPGVTLTGRIGTLPSPGLALGRAAPGPRAPWPKVTSYPDIEQLSAALATPLSPRILLLDPGAPFGYVRDWQAPGLSPLRHFSYAIQWWSFALLALIFWGVTSWRTAERAP
ncbi:MAG TPA: SURF1 family protein [Steroidobacteraceae bacterium]|jgi:surfeit locus 1 family protein|nr:SURF1 family protein [Steroidobacteraceae bacterium]